MWKHSIRILATLTAVFLISGCGDNSSGPTEMQLDDFVSGVQTSDGAVIATRLNGTPPAANGGPAVTPTVSGSSSAAVVSGGASYVRLRAASPFQTVYLSVIDDPLPGYYKLALATATTDTTVVVKLGPSIPENTFQNVFSVALGDSVGPPSSIANQIRTPTSVAVSGTNPTLGGGAQQFTATASFSDGTSAAVTDQSTWQSSATNVAQVTGTGLVSAVASGEADISAKFGNLTGQRRVTIAAAAAGTFTVDGTVTDATSGGRLPGVTITIGSVSTTTDASGNYTLGGIAAGNITVVASASSYAPSQQTIALSANTRIDFVLARVAPLFTVNGTVTDAASGGRLSGATVAIGSRTTTTDANGNYALAGIAGGAVAVVASATGYVTGQQTVQLSADTRVDFALARVTPTASIAIMNTPCTDTGTVNTPGPVSCTFAGSSTNVTSPVYSWTFVNAATGASIPGSGPQVSPTFVCGFSSGVTTFQVNVTLQVTGGGGPASASQNGVSITRPARQCGS